MGLPISGRKPRKEVRYPDDLDASERHEPEQVIISRHDGLRASADGAFEHAVVVGIGRDGVDGLRGRDVLREFRDALDGLRRARFRPPELPQQMPTDFLNDWIGDRDLPSMAISRTRFGLPPNTKPERYTFESSVTRVTDAVRLEIHRSGEERHPR